MVKATEFAVRDPFKFWREIRRLITDTSTVRDTPFSKRYPEVYHQYLEISAYHNTEFKKRLSEEAIK